MTLFEMVKQFILSNIEKHPIAEEGKTYERNIYYANGNDGTDFDWDCNGRTCEFFVYFATEKQLGYMKVYATKQGTLEGYVWDTERYSDGVKLTPLNIGIDKARALKRECMKLDNADKWDQVVMTL